MKRGLKMLSDSITSALISMSSRLLNSPTAQMEETIIETLHECRIALKVDRISCLPIEQTRIHDWRFYEAAGEGVPRVKSQLPASLVLEYRRHIQAGVVVSSDESPELLELASHLQDEKPLRHILVPISAMGKPWGLLACASFNDVDSYSEEFINAATVLGNMIASSIERVRHYDQLIKSRQDVVERNKRIIGERERERQNIARDLHDDFSQRLASLGIELSLASSICDEITRPVLMKCANELASITKDVQHLSRHLHPVVIERVGLNAAIQSHAQQVAERSGLYLSIELDDDISFNNDVSLHVYRIIQEALSNIVKHANASAVTITLKQFSGGWIELFIRDDGIGIAQDQAHTQSPSLGLQSMIERGELIGGELIIKRNDPKAGTTVKLSIKTSEV
ncbi:MULTISPECIES: GAF domain-containing sensor histidine kinase [Vibrio]|uniref:GAF domain-containing sensor histidine kinase n=1 Tax=Vibrio TaxID=662 RepID=UPI00107F58CC|nr:MULTISPECIES: GAF domain-containing sensor histidine kinase [Vibrio]MBE8565251.1 GAF domain-containing sensor histidine kinase [Vibrio sp. OPT20]